MGPVYVQDGPLREGFRIRHDRVVVVVVGIDPAPVSPVGFLGDHMAVRIGDAQDPAHVEGDHRFNGGHQRGPEQLRPLHGSDGQKEIVDLPPRRFEVVIHALAPFPRNSLIVQDTQVLRMDSFQSKGKMG
jgi:hypothetical protein